MELNLGRDLLKEQWSGGYFSCLSLTSMGGWGWGWESLLEGVSLCFVCIWSICLFLLLLTNEIGNRHESPGPALPDVPATVVHQVEHLSPLQVWLFDSGFVRLLIAASPIPHLYLHPRGVTLKFLPFLPLLTAVSPARKTIQHFPSPRTPTEHQKTTTTTINRTTTPPLPCPPAPPSGPQS